MVYENRKWVIIDKDEVENIDFSQVMENSENILIYTRDGSKTFVKFEGSTPSFLNGKTQYSHSEILTVLAGEDWTGDEIPE